MADLSALIFSNASFQGVALSFTMGAARLATSIMARHINQMSMARTFT
jgi:hypothetical protein